MTRLTHLRPRVKAVFLGLKPQQNRQTTRALHTGSAAWRALRKEALKRYYYACQGWPAGQHTPQCDGFATDVDHDDGDSHNNALSNLRPLSKACHSRKTLTEMQR